MLWYSLESGISLEQFEHNRGRATLTLYLSPLETAWWLILMEQIQRMRLLMRLLQVSSSKDKEVLSWDLKNEEALRLKKMNPKPKAS